MPSLRAFKIRVANVVLSALVTSSICFAQSNTLTPISNNWSLEQAAHLLRRAGFGGTPAQIERLHAMGALEAVDFLVDYDKLPVSFEALSSDQLLPFQPSPFKDGSQPTQEERAAFIKLRKRTDSTQMANMAEWWLRRMVVTPRPLEEKLVLFWHGHFTSGIREVRAPNMLMDQQQIFREHALKNFRTMLQRICTDPAMLRYLDNVSNIDKSPNENFGRELLELFTMGEGHYSEEDVRSVARAFTGWTINRETGHFMLDPKQHDHGVKLLFDRMGDLNGGNVLEMILARKETAEFVASRLWTFFAGVEPSPTLRVALGGRLRHFKYEFRPFLKSMFKSQAFFGPEVVLQKVKSPIELIVGMYRELQIRPENAQIIADGAAAMGQELFQPPNVKGWEGGRLWINTSSLLERYNFPKIVLYGQEARVDEELSLPEIPRSLRNYKVAVRCPNPDQPPFDPYPLLADLKRRDPDSIVDTLTNRLLAPTLSQPQRRKLKEYFVSEYLEHADKKSPDQSAATAVLGLIHLIMSTPEYQIH